MVAYSVYSGNLNGQRGLFVFDSNSGVTANFIGIIGETSNTGDYVNAGGYTIGTEKELKQYLGNIAYLDYKRSVQTTITSVIGSTGGFVIGPDLGKSVGFTTTILNYTPDPRITTGIIIDGGSASFTGNHMDEILIRDSNGIFQSGYLGRVVGSEEFIGGLGGGTGGNRALVELLAYGITGGNQSAKANPFSYSFGTTLENVRTGATATIGEQTALRLINLESYKDKIINQVGISYDLSTTSYSAGITPGVVFPAGITSATFGPQHLYFFNNDKRLFDYTTSILPAFAHGASAADSRVKQSSIFTLLAGTTSDPQFWGVTLDGISGGTLGYNSEFEEFAHYIIHSKVKRDNEISSIIYDIRQRNNIRDVDKISF